MPEIPPIREQIVTAIMTLVRPQPRVMEPKPTIAELEAILNSESDDIVDIRPDGSVTVVRASHTTVGAVADEVQRLLRRYMAENTQAAQRREQASAGKLGQCADELAFWKYQAIFGRAVMLDATTLGRSLPEDHAVWREAEAQLEKAREAENAERVQVGDEQATYALWNKE